MDPITQSVFPKTAAFDDTGLWLGGCAVAEPGGELRYALVRLRRGDDECRRRDVFKCAARVVSRRLAGGVRGQGLAVHRYGALGGPPGAAAWTWSRAASWPSPSTPASPPTASTSTATTRRQPSWRRRSRPISAASSSTTRASWRWWTSWLAARAGARPSGCVSTPTSTSTPTATPAPATPPPNSGCPWPTARPRPWPGRRWSSMVCIWQGCTATSAANFVRRVPWCWRSSGCWRWRPACLPTPAGCRRISAPAADGPCPTTPTRSRA